MIQNRDVDIAEFIKITSAGVQIADYTQVRAALIARYKLVYGSDIDLSTGSADGIYVSNLALIINNILQSVKMMYSNLDVNTASGVYLDALCRLSNVTRKRATNSICNIKIRNTGVAPVEIYRSMLFVDKAGTEWAFAGETFELSPSLEYTQIFVVCSIAGEVVAPAGWIDKTIELNYIEVVQEQNASVGSAQESDSDLRARRNQSSGANGTTTMSALVGALLNVSGIDDVKIYNNNLGSTTTAADTTSIAPHSVYVVVRQRDGVTISDTTLGTIIYERLTPGIRTVEPAVSEKRSFEYSPVQSGSQILDFAQIVHWKRSVPIAPELTVTIKPLSFFATSSLEEIALSLIEYLNKLSLSSVPTEQDVTIEAIYADPQFKGRATYSVDSVSFTSSTNADTYYNYTTWSSSWNASTSTWQITLE